MPATLKAFVQRWIISTLAVLVATYIVPGIEFDRLRDLFVATLVLGLLNSFLRPLLLLLSLPLVIVTLGLFTVVINALLLLLVSTLIGHDRFRSRSGDFKKLSRFIDKFVTRMKEGTLRWRRNDFFI